MTQTDDYHDLDKRVALLEQAFSHISNELHGINANLNRLVWAVAGGFIAALVTFVIRGGLA